MLASAEQTAARCRAEIVAADLAQPLPLAEGLADVVTAVMTFHELIYPPQLLVEDLTWRATVLPLALAAVVMALGLRVFVGRDLR